MEEWGRNKGEERDEESERESCIVCAHCTTQSAHNSAASSDKMNSQTEITLNIYHTYVCVFAVDTHFITQNFLLYFSFSLF